MFQKIIKILLPLFLFLFLVIRPVVAQSKTAIYFFWSKGCPHCAQEKVFLEKLVAQDPRVELKSYDLDQPESVKLLQKAGKLLEANTNYVPFTVIGDQYIVGYNGDDTTGKAIEQAIEYEFVNQCPDVLGNYLDENPDSCPEETKPKKPDLTLESINVPLLGKIKTRDVSLPFLTVVLGVLDGFNPCAMWALLFLISLLLGMKDRKRMWILGAAFIVTSAFVYFLFMAAWLNLFLFLGFIFWVRMVIGLVALGAGGYNIREYIVNREGVCKVTGSEKRQKVFEKIKKVAYKKEFVLALVGIILLAFGVNLVELICSAGLPAIYTQVLALSQLPVWQYYLYLLVYIFFFMIDDLFVFFGAMITLHAIGIEGKYARYSHLIGGSLMLLIGLLMIFRPEWLMFG